MEELKRKVKKELENIGEKGLSSSNLDTTYKLIDILKDLCEIEKDSGSYDAGRARDSRGRYMDSYDTSSYGHYPLDERSERHFDRMREGMYNYNEGKSRYRNGDSKQRMIDGVEMTMGAIVNFVESMVDFAETPTEKEIVRKYVDKLKNI